MVTGAAGFIGSHLAERLAADGHDVVGIDCFFPNYPRVVKEANLVACFQQPHFEFHELDLRTDSLDDTFAGAHVVMHEAAFAGLSHPWANFDLYMGVNIQATQRVLEACRTARIDRLVLASTSSIYGSSAVGNEQLPSRPVSPYGLTKWAAEQLCWTYARAFALDVVTCRYFSVYGPRQRPDMAFHRFAQALLAGRPIQIFGDGRQSRSNTYVSDCIAGTIRALTHGKSGRAYNIGGGTEVSVLDAIRLLEESTGRQAILEFLPARPGDQHRTMADCSLAWNDLAWQPEVDIKEGLCQQVEWVEQARSQGVL